MNYITAHTSKKNTTKNTMKTKQEQFDTLFAESKSKLYSIAFSYLNQRERAEEALQNSYIKAWRKFDSYDPEKKFINWMTTIVRNTSLDAIRDSKKVKHRDDETQSIFQSFVELGASYTFNPAPNYVSRVQVYCEDRNPASNPQLVLEEKELLENIREASENLPENIKAVMVPFIEGYTLKEISSSSKLTQKVIKQRILEGQKILRNVIEY